METLGGGLKVLGAIDSLRRRLSVADKVHAEDLEGYRLFLKMVIADPQASLAERIRATEVLHKIAASGDALALKLADYERADSGQKTGEEIEVTIRFDNRG